MVVKAALSYYFQNSLQRLCRRSSSISWDGKVFSSRKTICIIRANNSKEVSQAAQGVISTLMDCIENLHIIPVIGDNNILELTEWLYDIVHWYPQIDMIFSLGNSSTKIAQKVTAELGKNIPVFFILVHEEAASRVMRLASNVTGVVSPVRDYAEQFKNFFHFTQYDKTKKVLVPRSGYVNDLAGYTESTHLVSLLASHKIELEVVDITCRQDLCVKVKPLLSDIALVALPKDAIVETYVDELIAMANEQRIPLFSSSFESVEQGASISFGRSGYEFSKELALLAKPILMQGVHPAEFPAVKINNWVGTMRINREAAMQQGLKLNMERICADENVMLL